MEGELTESLKRLFDSLIDLSVLILFLIILSILFMLGWNFVFVYAFGLPLITFWHAFVMLWMVRVIVNIPKVAVEKGKLIRR